MSDESPPPYSAVVGAPLENPPAFESLEIALPFSHSDRFAIKILALVSEGKMLDSHFKDVRDVASAGAKFDCQEHAVILCQRFEALVWESRKIAGIALVAIKDFNEVILGFLSEPEAVVQDRLKELANASKLLQPERESAANQMSSFDALVKQLEDFHRLVHSELGAPIPKRRRQSQSGERGTRGTQPSRKSISPLTILRSEPLTGLSAVTASIGVISRTFKDYAQQFERMAEQAVFPPCVIGSPPEAPAQVRSDLNPGAAPSNPPYRKRLGPPTELAEPASLPDLVDALLRDLRAFANRVDVFVTVFAELARAQDIFILYLKDGQSIVNPGYRFEINRLRRHLPCVCDALDAYSKARPPAVNV